MRCLGTLFFIPILILFLIVSGIVSFFVNFKSSSRNKQNLNGFGNSRTRKYEDESKYADIETVDYVEITEDNSTTVKDDYDPNPSNNKRIEDAKWEEIE